MGLDDEDVTGVKMASNQLVSNISTHAIAQVKEGFGQLTLLDVLKTKNGKK